MPQPDRPPRRPSPLRTLRVGLCFVYFGVGVWLCGLTWLPWTRWRALRAGLTEDAATRRVQHAVHRFLTSFMACLTRVLRVAEVEWVGEDALAAAGPLLIVANHPSLIDTPVLAARLPQADFIVSRDWLEGGWMRRACEAAGYLRADDGPEVVHAAAARLRAGRTVVVYPEGSRTPREGLRPFQRGAAHIALETGCPILPVVIQVKPRALLKGERFTDYPSENPVWRVEVGEPIPVPRLPERGEGRALAARRLTGVLEEYFEKRWERGSI